MGRRLRRGALAAVLVVLAAAVVVALVERRGPEAKPLPGTPLRELASQAGLRIGTAVDDTALQREPGYREVLAQQFSSVTAENVMKWGALAAERGRYDFTAADRLVDFALGRGMRVRGHALVWWNQLPTWVRDGEWTRRTLRQEVRQHVRTTLEHFGERVPVWDAVNEPLDDRGRLRDDLLGRVLGDGWVEDVLRTARTYAPEAQLVLNETAADGLNAKSDGMYRLVRGLLARGVPLDGVGFQLHTNLDGVPAGFRRNLERFAALGLDVEVTEADVALRTPASERAERAQARVYAQAVRDCRAVPRCRGFTVWGFTDRHSWIPGTQPGFGEATLLDAELRAKPAFRAVQRALR